MTYMVMETHLSYCVVLDEAGRFIKAANKSYEIGQTVGQIEPLAPLAKKKSRLITLSAVSGFVAACLVVAFALYWSQFMTSFASVYLRINPEVRMEVSQQNRVVGLTGLNEDGAALIDGYEFRGKRLSQTSVELLERAIDMGFLSDGGRVVADIDAPDEAWFTKTGIMLRKNLTDYLTERMSVTVEVRPYTGQTESEEPPQSSASSSSSNSSKPEAPSSSSSSDTSLAPSSSGSATPPPSSRIETPSAPSRPVTPPASSTPTAPPSSSTPVVPPPSSKPVLPPASSQSSEDDSGYEDSGYNDDDETDDDAIDSEYDDD